MLALALLTLFLMVLPAGAHSGHAHDSGFTGGYAHPWSGLDHLLAMFAVGLWAWQMGGRAVWMIPATFLVVMSAGFLAGLRGVEWAVTEPMILSSVVVIGVALSLARKWPVAICSGVVGLFAFFHGFAHGNEMTANANALSYASGFLLGTLTLHLLGIAAGLLSGKWLRPVAVRYAGAAIALAGIILWI
ncbi:HupE/UreJ family protein [Oscillatoria amoena NRMC-F 0135]|nr:HupE/UreJ family protein [Oscillatoria amoena NRMC-F 0135]